MRLLFDRLLADEGPIIADHNVSLRVPRLSDHAEWARLREASREFLQPWEPTWSPDDLSRPAFRRRLELYEAERVAGQSLSLVIRETQAGRMVGMIRLINIRRGVAQSASVGYWTGRPFARRGYMQAALGVLIPFAFGPFRLSRLEAQCLTDNEPSRRLLLKVGFVEEGLARAYLKINGEWRDHRLFGLVSPERSQASADGAAQD